MPEISCRRGSLIVPTRRGGRYSWAVRQAESRQQASKTGLVKFVCPFSRRHFILKRALPHDPLRRFPSNNRTNYATITLCRKGHSRAAGLLLAWPPFLPARSEVTHQTTRQLSPRMMSSPYSSAAARFVMALETAAETSTCAPRLPCCKEESRGPRWSRESRKKA